MMSLTDIDEPRLAGDMTVSESAPRSFNKIFCIGFQKTGTSSMGAALSILGYKVTGARRSGDPQIAERALEIVEELVPQYDAFQDNPWALLYKHLDEAYPNSKFILTVRDPQSWLKSAVAYFGDSTTAMREWIYEGQGDPVGHEAEWLERYLRHNREVREYFRGREGKDFLVMDLKNGDGWEKLCPFLGVTMVEDEPFPHRNSRRENRRLSTRLRRIGRKIRKRLSR